MLNLTEKKNIHKHNYPNIIHQFNQHASMKCINNSLLETNVDEMIKRKTTIANRYEEIVKLFNIFYLCVIII